MTVLDFVYANPGWTFLYLVVGAGAFVSIVELVSGRS